MGGGGGRGEEVLVVARKVKSTSAGSSVRKLIYKICYLRADIFLMPDTSTLTASTASSSLLPPQSTRWPPLWLACGTLWCCFPLPCMSGRNESGVWLKLNAVAVAYIALDDGCRDCDRPLPHSFSTIVRVRPGRACACPPPLCVFGSCLTTTG